MIGCGLNTKIAAALFRKCLSYKYSIHLNSNVNMSENLKMPGQSFSPLKAGKSKNFFMPFV
jgi:hypothetical protein